MQADAREYSAPPFPKQHQSKPRQESRLTRPNVRCAILSGLRQALGPGRSHSWRRFGNRRAVAILFAREGAALLRHLGAHELVLAGITTNSCVLCTAHDAKMRDLKMTVVSDCCAARSEKEHKQAIAQIRDMVDACVVTLASLSFARSRNAEGGHAR